MKNFDNEKNNINFKRIIKLYNKNRLTEKEFENIIKKFSFLIIYNESNDFDNELTDIDKNIFINKYLDLKKEFENNSISGDSCIEKIKEINLDLNLLKLSSFKKLERKEKEKIILEARKKRFDIFEKHLNSEKNLLEFQKKRDKILLKN
jgi:hypothetical protein